MDELIKKAKKWINSKAGEEGLKQAYIRAKKNTDELDKLRQPDLRHLNEPMTR